MSYLSHSGAKGFQGAKVPPMVRGNESSSYRLSVRHRSCGRNFEQNWMKLCIVVWGRKTKIEFVGGQNPKMLSPILPPIFPKFYQS